MMPIAAKINALGSTLPCAWPWPWPWSSRKRSRSGARGIVLLGGACAIIQLGACRASCDAACTMIPSDEKKSIALMPTDPIVSSLP